MPTESATQTATVRATQSPWLSHARAYGRLLLWLALLLGWAWTRPGAIFVPDMLGGVTVLTLVVRLAMAGVRRRVRRAGGVPVAAVKLLLGLMAFGGIRWADSHWAAQWRNGANALVEQVQAWRAAHGGQYPPNYEAVAGQARPRGLAAPHYLYANDQPHLFYRSAWSGFDTWSYDFSTGHWVFQPD